MLAQTTGAQLEWKQSKPHTAAPSIVQLFLRLLMVLRALFLPPDTAWPQVQHAEDTGGRTGKKSETYLCSFRVQCNMSEQ